VPFCYAYPVFVPVHHLNPILSGTLSPHPSCTSIVVVIWRKRKKSCTLLRRWVGILYSCFSLFPLFPTSYMPSVNFNKRLERNKRYFGSFFCHRCKNSWRSGHAFQRHYQKCRQCNRRTYPNKLRALRHDLEDWDEEDVPARQEDGTLFLPSKTPHLEDRCQRCKKLGRSCVEEPAGERSMISRQSFYYSASS